MDGRKLILFHDRCFDGLGAAWVARQHLDWASADLVAVNYGPEPHPDVGGCDVLIVDFSYPRDILVGMAQQVRSLHVYDHHKTAEEALRGLDFCTFDMDRSGAGLVWDEMVGGPRPLAIDYIEDRDLWRHKLPYAAEVQAWMRSFPTTYETIETLVDAMAGGVTDEFGGPLPFVHEGAALLRYRRIIIEAAAKDAVPVNIGRYDGRAVNFGVNELYSEVAEEVGHGHAFGVAWRLCSDGRVFLSFRSDPTGVDVSQIARSLGGGGHKHAAGAYVTREMLLDLLDSAQPAFLDGVHDCAQDASENVPFGSVGGLDMRTSMVAPIYERLGTADAEAMYLRGYAWEARRSYGPDWRTCKFGWSHAITLHTGAASEAS